MRRQATFLCATLAVALATPAPKPKVRESPLRDAKPFLAKTQKQVEAILGKPDFISEDEAGCNKFRYLDSNLLFTMQAPWQIHHNRVVVDCQVYYPCTWATPQGVGIGTPEKDARRAYADWPKDWTERSPQKLCIYAEDGKVTFTFQGGKVCIMNFSWYRGYHPPVPWTPPIPRLLRRQPGPPLPNYPSDQKNSTQYTPTRNPSR